MCLRLENRRGCEERNLAGSTTDVEAGGEGRDASCFAEENVKGTVSVV